MDADRDLKLLRAWRQEAAPPPADLQARIQERLWQSILEEERGRATSSTRAGRWVRGLLRPAVAAGAASTIAIGIALATSDTTSPTVSNAPTIRAAGILDATATTLFGQQSTSRVPNAPIAGMIDLSSAADDHDRALASGPVLVDGELDDGSQELAATSVRDPAVLRERMRAVARTEAGDPVATDRIAFNMAMRWVAEPRVPSDLRAAMLRALHGMSGIDGAIAGVDLLGRHGVVIGHLDARTGVREQYVLRPDGGQLLERRAFVAGYIEPACMPGTFTEHALFSEEGERVLPADAPWLDWPTVVASCDRGRPAAD